MYKTLKIVKIDRAYCDYLRTFDKRVSYNFGSKENRPYVGVLFKINKLEYFAPLSSPKPKHLKMRNMLDFLKLDDGRLGAINFNNMIPVTANNYTLVDFDIKCNLLSEIKYLLLLKNQLAYMNANYDEIVGKSYKLYNLYIDNKLPRNIKDRCCNFPLLEEKSKEYNKEFQMS